MHVNTAKLDEIKERYGIQPWEVQFELEFSLKPNRVDWDKQIATIRPLNLWSYLKAGFSIDKRNDDYNAKVLAHELRHAQQKPPDNSLKTRIASLRYLYWFHPLEVDARNWRDEHWREFKGIVEIEAKK